MTLGCCIYYALCFYYYINSTSDHQTLDPGDWGILLWRISLNLLVLQKELESVQLTLSFRKKWLVIILMTGHVDSCGIRDHVLGHELWGSGLFVPVALWSTEPRKLWKDFWPNALKNIPNLTAQQKLLFSSRKKKKNKQTHDFGLSFLFFSSHPQSDFQHMYFLDMAQFECVDNLVYSFIIP